MTISSRAGLALVYVALFVGSVVLGYCLVVRIKGARGTKAKKGRHAAR